MNSPEIVLALLFIFYCAYYIQLPEISIFSESYTTGNVEIVALPNGKINGKTMVSLVSKDSGYLSKGTFKGLSISPGLYVLYAILSNSTVVIPHGL